MPAAVSCEPALLGKVFASFDVRLDRAIQALGCRRDIPVVDLGELGRNLGGRGPERLQLSPLLFARLDEVANAVDLLKRGVLADQARLPGNVGVLALEGGCGRPGSAESRDWRPRCAWAEPAAAAEPEPALAAPEPR
jgi:hypothetical protein